MLKDSDLTKLYIFNLGNMYSFKREFDVAIKLNNENIYDSQLTFLESNIDLLTLNPKSNNQINKEYADKLINTPSKFLDTIK